MNPADRFGMLPKSANNIMVPPSPTASQTRMARQLNADRQDEKSSEVRAVVTPSSFRGSMKPIRDTEFEYLKKFQTELFRSMVTAKDAGLYNADFTLASREIDEYTLDYLFDRLVQTLRAQKFFVAVGPAAPRSFIVSWDPILTPDSITQEERDNPNSIASIRLRRYARLQKKHLAIANDEKKVFQEYQEYLQIMKDAPDQFRKMPQEENTTRQTYTVSEKKPASHSLQIDEGARARRSLMSNMLDVARFKQYPNDESFYGSFAAVNAMDGTSSLVQQPLREENEEIKAEALDMIREANRVTEEQ